MFLLDTNVVSELRRRDRAAPTLLKWIDNIEPTTLYLSAISLLELDLGALRAAHRDKRQGAIFTRWIEDAVLPAFGDRILPIDSAVARICATLHVPDPRPERDALIAATALVHRLTVATRNVRDFEPLGVALIDPWNV